MTEPSRIDDLRRRVQQDPASIAFAQLGEEYRRAGQLVEAVDACQNGLKTHPQYVSARVTLGRALLGLGRLTEASAELRLALASAPDNLAARRALAETCRRLGLSAEAYSHYTAALGLAPNDPDLERIVGDLRDAAETEPLDRVASAGGGAVATLAALEQWLEAIHATRADRHS